MPKLDPKALDEKVEAAAKQGAQNVIISRYDLAVLLGAYKQLQYQHSRGGRKEIVNVTDTDQNPA